MSNEGDRLDESTTSYGLQPPRQPGPTELPGARLSSPRAYEPTEIAPPAAASGGDPGTGRLIGGRYRLMARLGHGGMGTVWRAHDEVVDRDVAVKEPRLPDHLSERERETMYTRMRREARTAARIDHPSVVTIHDVAVEDEQPWIVMELVQGRSLADVLEEGTIDVREAARIGLAVAGALDAAHEKGVLHRDVKPDNVMLGRYDRVVLTDFGIAKVQGEQGLTETGAFVGSPEFVAPERVLGQRPGPESDLWSLGVVLYAAVEGVSPFRRSNSPATLQAVLSAEPQRPARALSGSGAFGMLLTRLLSKEPALRPDAAEVRQTLADVARPPQQSPRPVPGPGGGNGLARLLRGFGGRLRSSRPWQFGTGGAVVAAAAALALFFVYTADQAPEGYTTKNEDKRVRASLAVPEDYKRSANEDEVTYIDPGNVISLKLSRSSKDIKESSLLEANSWKGYYEEGAKADGYRETMEEVVSRVTEAKQQGKEAAEISTGYRPRADIGEDKEPKKFRHELVYVNKDGVRWRLYVDMPAAGKTRKDGEAVYQEAKKSLKINDL
ncbi:serine/threonine-protein kinase [Streptomyces spirodelae]|uniref:non-specific serine/threonine protein kinase n=1 Tax=Streptomyces spirodelae TaxID=2812904 RepID=A0ABS3WUB8_9ACTN|nr:serine/threonine-protein kinase [Streptomyces spirodelae]MBO8186724.1 serine/threonine protein kinase [Streptomyces spirodelae]